MIPPPQTAFREVVRGALAQRSGVSPNAQQVAVAARGLYGDLARVCAPLIGQLGFDALAARAIHLARSEHECLSEAVKDGASPRTFDEVTTCLARQTPAVATATGAAVVDGVTVLLATFIGPSLTAGLLRRAWPDAFIPPSTEET